MLNFQVHGDRPLSLIQKLEQTRVGKRTQGIPVGRFSTLMTSAPYCAKSRVTNGPGNITVMSIIRRCWIGRSCSSFQSDIDKTTSRLGIGIHSVGSALGAKNQI